MRRIGRQHDPAALGEDANDLQTVRMAAYMMHRQARRQFLHPVDEDDPVVIDLAQHVDHIVDRIGHVERLVPHVAAGGECHLAVLQIELRLGEVADRTGMVVMQVRDDDVLDLPCIDAQQFQPFGRAAQ